MLGVAWVPYWSAWFLLTIALKRPIFWLIVDSRWGLRDASQFTFGNLAWALVLVLAIPGALAWLLTGGPAWWARRNPHL